MSAMVPPWQQRAYDQAVEALDASLDEDEDVAESTAVAVTDAPSPQA